jgi:hypothetical protein
MLTPEQRAQIARENGAKSQGPVTPEGKEHSRRNAITHGNRAAALKLIVPPHSACLANEDRQAFYTLFDSLTAKFRPADETELQLVREIAEYQWKINRNKQMESALFNRELMRQAARITPSLPELRDLEINIAAHEALTGNRTVAELRKDTLAGIRAIAQLQRRLVQLQKHWPAAVPVPPTVEEDRLANTIPDPETPEPAEPAQPAEPAEPPKQSNPSFPIKGRVTPNVLELYSQIFHQTPPDDAAPEPQAA